VLSKVVVLLENDKLFDFMNKIYNEMQQGFRSMNNRFEVLENDVKEMKGDIKKLNMKIDGEITDKLKALGDGYKQVYELNTEISDRVERNTNDISEINMSLTDMKDDINYIAGKTIKHDSKINKLSEQLKAAR
jgi:methyl-accepting chemotaxis protein